MLIIIPKGIIVIIQIRYLFFDTLVTIQNRHYCLLARIRIVENFSMLQVSTRRDIYIYIYIYIYICARVCFVLFWEKTRHSDNFLVNINLKEEKGKERVVTIFHSRYQWKLQHIKKRNEIITSKVMYKQFS
jgi:hypothetical protein